jgi:ribosomal protein L13E
MKPILSSIFTLISFSALAAPASLPAPLVLSSNEEIVFEGGAGDSVQCNDKNYNKQVFNIKVTKNAKECDADGNLLRKIYIDGVLTDVCNTDIKTGLRDLKGTFTDFDDLLALSDEDFRKFLGNWNNAVGNCQFQEPSTMSSVRNDPSGKLQNSFQTYLVETQIELKQSKPNDATITKAARDFIKAGLCGSYSPARLEANKKDSLKFFGRSNVGYDAFVKKGFTVDQLVEMQYPVKTLKLHGVGIDKLVAAGKTVRDLYYGGFTVNDLKSKFSLKDMVSADLTSELKSNGFKAQDLKTAGASLTSLKAAGFTPSELKSIFTIQDFIAVKNNYNGRGISNEELRSAYGFSAAELKGVGVGIKELNEAGFDLKKDLKPLFGLNDFLAVRNNYNGRQYSTETLRSMGFTPTELKVGGMGIKEIQEAGFDLIKDIKPIFTLKDFLAVRNNYNGRQYSTETLRGLGYSVAELKANDIGIKELQEGGFDISKDIKPNFTLSDFMAVKNNWNGRQYSTEILRTMGFSAPELKEGGAGIKELQEAGFDTVRDIKPLFKLSDFIDVKNNWNGRAFSTETLKGYGYTVPELKGAGISITELVSAGFDMKTDIKPNFDIEDFIQAKNQYNGRAYSNQVMRENFGFTAKEMRDEGMGLQDLFSAGFTKQELKDAGFAAKAVDAL